jgi:hypothetical protein
MSTPATAIIAHALITDEMQRLAARFVKFDRSEAAAFEHLTEIVERRVARLGQPDGISPSRMAEMLEDEVAHRSADVRLEIAASDYALFCTEIDQNQGPLGELRNARYDRP